MKETDVYREFSPPAYLRGSIACLWMRRGDGGTVRVLPDACTDIVWRPDVGAVVAGPDTGPSFSRTHPAELIVGARFLPGAGGPALGYHWTNCATTASPWPNSDSTPANSWQETSNRATLSRS